MSERDTALRALRDQLEMTATWIDGHPNLECDGDPEGLLIKTWHVMKLRKHADELAALLAEATAAAEEDHIMSERDTALRALVERWRAEADGHRSMAERRHAETNTALATALRLCADELAALLAEAERPAAEHTPDCDIAAASCTCGADDAD